MTNAAPLNAHALVIGNSAYSGGGRLANPVNDAKAIATGKEKTIAAALIMDAQLGKSDYLAGDEFSYGDIPVGIMIYRYVQLIPERPATANLDRWYAGISSRAAFRAQVAVVPLS